MLEQFTNFIRTNSFSVIWFIFVALFFYMAYREYKMSKRGIEIKDLNLGFSDLNEAYDSLRKGIIGADKSSHKIAATSYFFAGLVALASFIFFLFSASTFS